MICQVSRNANDYVTGWMNRQPEVKEESITDWLLDFFDQHTNEVWYFQFNRQEEGRFSGADWDWWILLETGSFKLRIQAKKVKLRHNHYNDLARNNQTGFQIDLLLNSSAVNNFYPLYTIFGQSEGVERCQRPPTQTSIHICSAQEIYNLVFNGPRQRIESSDIMRLTIPLECLFCCPLVTDPNGNGPNNLFDNYFQEPPRDIIDGKLGEKSNSNRGFEEKVPEIITILFDTKEINDNTAGMIQEYKLKFPGSNGLSIVKVDGNNQIKRK